jgi:hypothetical protein
MSEWQPIKTAPKDGTGIIAWREEPIDEDWFEPVGLPGWSSPMGIVWSETRGGSWRLLGMNSIELGDHGQPTHWMPLPAPPQSSDS